MSDSGENPFLKYKADAPADAENPFAKYKAAAAPPPAATAEPAASPPGMLQQADDLLSQHPVYRVAKEAVPPVANFLVADPIRNLAADVVGGVRSPPFSEKGREGFWREREKSLEQSSALRVPETETGQALTAGGGAVGSGLAKALGAGSEFLFGEQPTTAMAPFAQAAGDLLPAIGAKIGAARGANRPPGMIPNPAAAEAHAAGYRLPPEEISADQGAGARFLSGLSGKWKKQQAFSEVNQENTNALAARAIGLPPETRLTEAAIDKAKQPAVAVYDALKTEAPETVLGADPTFRQAVEGVGVRNELVERYFPEAVNNPSIATLREQLLQNATSPTDAVMKKIADLRTDSRRNFKKRDDAQSHALGYAQRQAATALEDAIERSIGYGPDRVSAFAARDAAVRQMANAQAALSGSRTAAPGGMPTAQAALAQTTADLNAKLAALTPAEIAKAQASIGQFRAARQLFAKIYDIESALNPATRDVVARRVAATRKGMRQPLTGEMKQIADASDAFPRDTQAPPSFGALEDFSVLDIIGGVGAAAAGHPLAAAVVAGRHPARNLLLSPGMQTRMFNRQPFISTPGSGAAAGELAMPREDDPISKALGY